MYIRTVQIGETLVIDGRIRLTIEWIRGYHIGFAVSDLSGGELASGDIAARQSPQRQVVPAERNEPRGDTPRIP